ncbi:MAG TPA: DEAD/DEAH box helicase [Methanoculleus sp.]|nr:DEAD/DEAH box helicase [Methanoculleus sp.]
MNIIVHPYRGSYRLFFFDGRRVAAVGVVDLAKTARGYRPKNYRVRRAGRRQFRNTPTKDLVAQFRQATVSLTARDEEFEAFLADLQIPVTRIRICRSCLLEDRITPLAAETAVRYGRETICVECARRELRREVGYMGGMGAHSASHIEKLLLLYRDLDRVLALIQPESPDMSRTLFDRLEAHPVQETAHINELPLPLEFRDAAGVETLMPVQQLAVEAGLLQGRDLLAVAATASGKTFIGEMAGIKNCMERRGRMLFLVPLVALANQKYERFSDRYGTFLPVSLHTGVSRLNLPETRTRARRDINASVIVATYEGIDHLIRCGRSVRDIGTVVIDEVQMLEDPERGHRLDGLIARLKYLAPQAQFLYLSATIGMPGLLAEKLNARLVRYEERPVPLERHLIFTERKQKIPLIKRLTTEEFRTRSAKGYRGQSIVFTNARARCHVIADALGRNAMPYHAGLSSQERREVEGKFARGEIGTVVTTAALAAGVDFPASQVIFDSLAMGIEWLSVGEFRQMMGRAGRPDFHDLGTVVVLAEPGGTYARNMRHTEEEMAIMLLRGEMEEVAPVYGDEESSEEYVANAVVCGGNEKQLDLMTATMVGEMEVIFPLLRERKLVRRKGATIEISPMARVMAEHFIGIDRLTRIQHLVREMDDPVQIVAELDVAPTEEEG